MIRSITTEEFASTTRALVGLEISRAWIGYGTAAILELGALREETTPDGRTFQKGEATVMIGWSWRVEGPWSILFGSTSTRQQVTEGLTGLENATLANISLDGTLPELVVELSNGMKIRSFMSADGDPEWLVMLSDGSALFVEAHELRHAPQGEPTEPEITAEEELVLSHSEQCARRWGAQVPPSHLFGRCEDCAFFRPMEGEFYFYDFGVCTNPGSAHDASVVAIDSGCPAFSESLAGQN
jgi:hypothetical protein